MSGKDGESATENPEIYIDMIVDSYTEPTQIEVLLESPGETQYWTFPESVSVQNFKVNYQHTYEAPDTSPSGTWFVRKIRLTNAEGEVITYDRSLLDNKGFTTSIGIENVIGDVNAPELVSLGEFTVTGNDGDTSTNIEVSIEALVTDQEDGLDRVYGVLESPKNDGGEGFEAVWGTLDKTVTPNKATFVWVLDPKTVSGQYNIEDIRLYDEAGNQKFYYDDTDIVADYLGTYGDFELTINNTIQDSQTPSLSDFLLTGSYDDQGRKTLSVRTQIDFGNSQNSAIKRQFIRVIGPNTGDIDDDQFVLQGDNYYQLDIVLPLEAEDGEYFVDYWFITDKALNDNLLSGDEIAGGGYSKSIIFDGSVANNKPVILNSRFEADENQLDIGIIVAYDPDDPDADNLTYAISGTDAQYINVNSFGSLQFKSDSRPDYETRSSYTIIAEVSDNLHTTQKALPINILNLNDNNPVITSPNTFSVIEGVREIGQIQVTDADGETDFTFFNDNFDIAVDDQGNLTFTVDTDYDVKSTYADTIYVVDAAGNETSQSITINLNKENVNAPIFTSGSFSPDENQTFIGNVTATDPDGDTITYEIYDGYDGAENEISIDANTGALTFNSAPDYETRVEYRIFVRASDGVNDAEKSVYIEVQDTNDNAPVFVSSETFTVDENTKIVGTLSVTDVDGVGDQPKFSVDNLDTSTFEVGETSGVLSFLSEPDYETQSTYTLRVYANDGVNSASQTINISVNDLDEIPIIESGVIFRSEENQINIGSIEASDPEGENLTYSISGTDAELILVDSASGLLTFLNEPDYEVKSLYSFTGEVSDGVSSVSKDFTIEIINLNDNIPELVEFRNSYDADENQTLAAQIYARDADGGANTFSVGGTNGSDFNIVSEYDESINLTIGTLSFITAPDFESQTSYEVSINVSDDDFSRSAETTINIVNLNDNSPVFTSNNTFTADENQTSIGTISASDADGDTVTFQVISGSNVDIDSSSGVLSFTTAPDYETKSSYAITVSATDGTNSTNKTISISINNLNDNAPVIATNQTFLINETTTGESSVSDYNIAVSDADADGSSPICSFIRDGGAVSNFISNIGDYTISDCVMSIDNKNTDYESGNIAESITLRATDEGGLVSEDVNITVEVINLNDNAPTLVDGANTAFPLSNSTAGRGCLFEEETTNIAYAEGSAATDQDCVLSTFAADADGSALTYAIVEDTSQAFGINSQTGAIAPTKIIDYEVDNADKDITVRISDGVFASDFIFTMRPVATDEAPGWTFQSDDMLATNSAGNQVGAGALFLPRNHVYGDDDANALHPLWIEGKNESGQPFKGYRIPGYYFGYRDGDGTAIRYTLNQTALGKLKMAQYETTGGVNQKIYSPDADPDNPLTHDSGGTHGGYLDIRDPNTNEIITSASTTGQILDPALPAKFRPFLTAGTPLDNPNEITDVAIDPQGLDTIIASTGGYFAQYGLTGGLTNDVLSGTRGIFGQYIGQEFVGYVGDTSQHSGPLTVDTTYGNSGDGNVERKIALCTGYYEKDGVTQNGLWKVLVPVATGDPTGRPTSEQYSQIGKTISHYQDQDDSGNNHRCGIKLSDDGTYVAAGNPNYKDPDTGHTIGAVYVYRQVEPWTTASGNAYYLDSWRLVGTFTGHPEADELLGLDGTFDFGGLRKIFENGDISREEVVRLAIRNKALGHASVWELDRFYTGDPFWIDNDLPEQELYWNYSWNLVGEKTDDTGAKYSFDCGTGIVGITLSLSGNQMVCSTNTDADGDGFNEASFKVAFYDEVNDEWTDSTTKFLSPNNDRSEVSFTAENNVATSHTYSSNSRSIHTGGADAPLITQNGKRLAFSYDYGNTDVWYWNDFAYNKQLGNDINYYSQRHLPLNLDLEFELGEAGNESAWHTDMSDDGKVIIKVRKNPLGTSASGPMEGAWYRLLVRGDNMDSWTGYREDL